MTPKQQKAHLEALLALRADTLAKGAALIEPNRTDDSTSGVADEDAQALSEMLQAIASRRNLSQSQQVARIDRALKKLRSAPGDFGLCEECEEKIPAARLKAMPYARLCVNCQSKKDAPKAGPTRRKITDYI